MRALVYIQSRDDRSAFRPVLGELVTTLIMVNTAEEALAELRKDITYDILIFDDSFDKKTEEGHPTNPGPSVMELLQEVQAGYTNSSGAMTMVMLRPDIENSEPGMTSFAEVQNQEDRKQEYSELGALIFLAKPYTLVQITASMKELLKAAAHPPQWLVILRELKNYTRKGEHKKALSFISKLEETGIKYDQLGLELTRAKSLGATGKQEEAIKVLRALELEYPKSLSIKMNLKEFLLDLDQPEDAFETQLSILKIQKSAFYFEKTMILFERLCSSQSENIDTFAITSGKQVLKVLLEDPLPYSKKTRCILFEHMVKHVSSPEGWKKLLPILINSTDIIEETLFHIKTGISLIEKLMLQDDFEAKELFYAANLAILKELPADPTAIEAATDYYLHERDNVTLDAMLIAAQKAGADSIEYYIAFAKFHLFQQDLRAASDILHKAVQIQADDDRVLALRKEWKSAYAAKNT